MSERTIEDMCVVCNDHNKPSCGYEERNLQRKCPYNDFIERGYDLAEQDLALTIADIYRIHVFLYAVKNNKQGAFTFTRLKDEQYQEVLEKFNKTKEEE